MLWARLGLNLVEIAWFLGKLWWLKEIISELSVIIFVIFRHIMGHSSECLQCLFSEVGWIEWCELEGSTWSQC